MADHNDPNAVNSIFSDIDVSAADVYDLFGYPSDDRSGGERVVIALTFASVPTAGVFDTDMLYRLQVTTARRVAWPDRDRGLDDLLHYVDAVKDKYLGELRPAEVRVTADAERRAKVDFLNFPGGSFSVTVDLDSAVDREGARRERNPALPGRARRRVLQRPAGVLPVDQLRAPVLPRAPHAARPARAPDPEDAARARGEPPLQLRPEEPAPRPRREDRPAAGAAHVGGRPLREGRRRQLPVRLQRRRRPGRART